MEDNKKLEQGFDVENEEAVEKGISDIEESVSDSDMIAAEAETAKESNDSSVYIGIVGAVTKLQEELKMAKDKNFAEPVIGYLIERCKESESLASDVCQDHKSWEKCYKYIYEQARKQAKGNSCAVRDDVVYEWSEDYYHKDDKAEEEKKAKEAAEKKKKATTNKENKARADYDTTRKSPADNHKLSEAEMAAMDKKEAPKPQPKKNNNDMDGQMDLFSMMGM